MWSAVFLFFFLGEVTLKWAGRQLCCSRSQARRRGWAAEGKWAPVPRTVSVSFKKQTIVSSHVGYSNKLDLIKTSKQVNLPSWEGRVTCTITRVLLTLNFVDGVRCWASQRRGGIFFFFFTSEVGTLLLNLFKWFTRQLSLHGLLPNDVPHKKPRRNAMMHNRVLIHIQQHLKKNKIKITAQVTGWGRGSVLQTHHRGPRCCKSEHCNHPQHANDSAEMILLHLNMNKAIFESPINVSLSQAGYSGPRAPGFIFWW